MALLERLLQPIWEISSEPLVITGNEADLDDQRILHVNTAFTEVTGYSQDDVIGQSPSLLQGAETDKAAITEVQQLLREGQPQEYALVLYRKDGSSFRSVVTSAPLVDVDGTSEYIVSMWRLDERQRPLREPGPPGTVSLTVPMPLQEMSEGRNPEHLASHPELEALEALWREVSGERPLPSRSDLDLRIMRRWAPHISIALVTSESRFQFRLFGTRLADVYGRDLTGCYLDELTPHDLWSVVIQHYREVVRTRQPLYAPISVTNGRWYTEVSRLLLPLSNNGGVHFIMGADYRREHL